MIEPVPAGQSALRRVPCHRLGISAALLGCGILAGSAAAADRPRSPPEESIPFVEAGGLIHAGLTRSAVIARLGMPPAVIPKESAFVADVPGTLPMVYPHQGLVFVIPADERAQADPRIGLLIVRPPSTARTPEGIRLGMHWSAIREIPVPGKITGQGSTLHWHGTPNAGQRSAALQLDSQNVLASLRFNAGIPLEARSAALVHASKWIVAFLLLAILVLAAPKWAKGYREYAIDWIERYAPLHAALGRIMLVAAPLLVVIGFAMTTAGGALLLLGALMVIGGMGLLLPAMLNLALGGSPTTFRWLAMIAIGVVTLALVLSM